MSETIIKLPWKGQKEGFQDSLRYLKGRQQGIIKSLKTPWTSFNNATTAGIEWNSLTVIGGRPATGKTLIKDQLITEAFKINHGERFRVLEFSLEMVQRVAAIREYSRLLGKSYKYLCSADGSLSPEHLQMCFEYAQERVKYPIDIVEEPCTTDEFRDIIIQYLNHHIDKGKYINTIVTLDHSLLLKQSRSEKNRMDALYNLGETITSLKRKFPIAFIVLSQLNRNVDDPKRNEERKYGNYILPSDIMGADALLQHADTVVGLNRPMMQQIRFYGPKGYFIENDKMMAMHFLKCRNGENGIAFFNAQFEKMTITETPTPTETSRK